MDNMKLYEGINNIDDDLINEADIPARRPKYYTFALSAAAILLVVGVSGIAFNGNGKYYPRRYVKNETPIATECSTTAVTSSRQDTVTSCADTVTTCKTKETTHTTQVNKEVSSSRAETSAKASTNAAAAPETTKASASTAAESKTTTSVRSAVTSAQKPVTQPATSVHGTVTQPVSTDVNNIEGSNDMKKILSLLSAAVMVSPVAAENVYAADAAYKDPAERYGLGSERYIEDVLEVSLAEQELFERIDNGIIDIDIDRNGELDMRDAALLYFYELKQYTEELSDDEDISDEFYKNKITQFDISTIPAEAWDFLETRENIRNKELFSKSRYYEKWDVAHLDSDLIIRYHLTHTLTPDYFTNSYYRDIACYDIIERLFESEVASNRNHLLNKIREKYFTDLDYDLNGDGVFDLHDAQDYVEYQFGYNVKISDCKDIASADHVDISKYRKYTDSDDSISETVFKNCARLEFANAEYEDMYGFDFQKNSTSKKAIDIGFQKMIELFFMRNDYKLVYSTPEYYTENRPGCEGLPLYDRIDFYSFVDQYAGSHGYTNAKICFNETTFNLFYEEWSSAVKNGSADIPDINGNGKIDPDDYSFLEQYESEIWKKTPADESELPENIRSYLDNDFDLNQNGISGDLYEIMSAMAFIRINYPQCCERTVATESMSAKAFSAKGDANCDSQISVADAVAILQFIGNRDRYNLTDEGKQNADVNGDGAVTPLDALEIQKIDADISD